MDELGNRLRQDAEDIEVVVSDELDRRIAASLRGVTPGKPGRVGRERVRPAGFWWASSVTGIAAAAAVIFVINARQEDTTPVATPPPVVVTAPLIDLRAETATLTGALEQELENLQSDMRKAEEQVRRDIGL